MEGECKRGRGRPKLYSEGKKFINICLPEEVYNKLAKMAHEQYGDNLTWLVNRIITEYLKNEEA